MQPEAEPPLPPKMTVVPSFQPLTSIIVADSLDGDDDNDTSDDIDDDAARGTRFFSGQLSCDMGPSLLPTGGFAGGWVATTVVCVRFNMRKSELKAHLRARGVLVLGRKAELAEPLRVLICGDSFVTEQAAKAEADGDVAWSSLPQPLSSSLRDALFAAVRRRRINMTTECWTVPMMMDQCRDGQRRRRRTMRVIIIPIH